MTAFKSAAAYHALAAGLSLPSKAFIDGEWHAAASGDVFETLNPATGAVLGLVAHCDIADVDRAVAAAQIQEIIERLSIVVSQAAGGAFAMSASVWLELKRTLLSKLQAFHADNPDLPGIGLERLRLQLEPRLPAPARPAVPLPCG